MYRRPAELLDELLNIEPREVVEFYPDIVDTLDWLIRRSALQSDAMNRIRNAALDAKIIDKQFDDLVEKHRKMKEGRDW